MEYEFKKQRYPEHLTTGDEIELYNCEDHGMNGDYTIVDLNDTGEATLVGMGKLSGFITVVNFGQSE